MSASSLGNRIGTLSLQFSFSTTPLTRIGSWIRQIGQRARDHYSVNLKSVIMGNSFCTPSRSNSQNDTVQSTCIVEMSSKEDKSIVEDTQVLCNMYMLIQFEGKGLVRSNCLMEPEESILVEQNELVGMIKSNIVSRELLQVNGEDVNGIEHARVLDLNDEGERWEGDALNDKPYGWGVLYDSENRRVYEGFRLKDVNVCYGRSYYADIQKLEYEGAICEGKRWGRGVQYDRNSNTVFDGEWMNGEQLEKRITITAENQFLHNWIEELIVSDKCFNERAEVLEFTLVPNLRELIVGDDCFKNVEVVKWIGMKRLEKVVIGKNCFTNKSNHTYVDIFHHFYLKDCDELRELRIGRYSFSDYCVCEIENLKSLEVMEIGTMNESSCNFFYSNLTVKSNDGKNN